MIRSVACSFRRGHCKIGERASMIFPSEQCHGCYINQHFDLHGFTQKNYAMEIHVISAMFLFIFSILNHVLTVHAVLTNEGKTNYAHDTHLSILHFILSLWWVIKLINLQIVPDLHHLNWNINWSENEISIRLLFLDFGSKSWILSINWSYFCQSLI